MERKEGVNRLRFEKSPYLQQHKSNPVDWFTWGEAAFEKARLENKPIFLSIGYSTCHWCHVMARESFENPKIAEVLNRDFVSIKVDREERPDVDALYMSALLALAGAGGWPLSAWLTPDGRPFFAGTYFSAQHFLALCEKIATLWRDERERLLDDAEKFNAALKMNLQRPAESLEPSRELLSMFESEYENRFDDGYGGFQGAPKFPQSMSLMALMRIDSLLGSTRTREFVDRTLEAMISGGLWDSIEGGFHRYCIDENWSIPHYEKMLYDQAWISHALFEASRFLQNETFVKIGERTLAFVCEHLRHPEGGFYSALDAESVDPTSGKKQEGFYYKLSAEARPKNPKPARDEKVIVAWNGWMISALCTGYETTGNTHWLEAARSAWKFVNENARNATGLARRWSDGDVSIPATSEDYASLISAGIALYQSTREADYLKDAVSLQEDMNRLFWDSKDHGFLFSSANDRHLLFRFQQESDGVTPGSNSLSCDNLIKLNFLTGEFSGQCDTIFRKVAADFASAPLQHPYSAIAIANRDLIKMLELENPKTCTPEGCADPDPSLLAFSRYLRNKN